MTADLMKVCLPDENDRSGIFRNEEWHQSTVKELHSEVVIMIEAIGLNLMTRLKIPNFPTRASRQGEATFVSNQEWDLGERQSTDL